MPKTKEEFTQAWGRTKTEYIRFRIRQGDTPDQAAQAWRQKREELRQGGVNYPPTFSVLTATERAGPSQITEEIQTRRDDLLNQRRQAAQEQRHSFLQNLRDKRLQEQERLLNENTPVKGKPSKTSTPNQPNESQGFQAQDSVTRSIDFSTGSQTQDVLEPDNPAAMSSPMEGPSNPRKRPADGDAGPGELPPPPGSVGGSSGGGGGGDANTSGAPSAGLNDSRGAGGGGGLAGAGNNAFFHGFAQSTKPRDPDEYTYVDTYRRPWATHTPFPKGDEAEICIMGPKTQTSDAATAGPQGYNATFIPALQANDGILVPYWIMEGSMRVCDWNKPVDHIGYKLEEIGFDIPNLRLNIMNNDKGNADEVAPAPPADARMWIFCDINNDYGLPEAYESEEIQHNNYFTHEDIIEPTLMTYSLPTLGGRMFALDEAEACAILKDRNWTAGETAGTVTSSDANSIYDLKRHPGYHETILSEAKMGLSYKCHAPIVRFPHTATTTLDWGARQPQANVENQWNASLSGEAGPGQIHQWRTYRAPELWGRTDTGQEPADITAVGLLNYYAAGISAYTKQIIDGIPANPITQNAVNQLADHQVRPTGSAAASLNSVACVNRVNGREDTDDSGKIMMSHISKRPPIFMFGIYKELEYRASGPEFWRYFAYGQVEYYCKIRWIVQPSRYKPYIHIGLGGVYENDWTTALASGSRYSELTAKKIMRKSHKPLLESTAYDFQPGTALRASSYILF